MPADKPVTISDRLIEQVVARVAENKPVRRTLPEAGRINIDRQLPFMVVYRPPTEDEDVLTAQLVKGEASYLIAPRSPKHRRSVTKLITAVADTMIEAFGAFLIIEVWAEADVDSEQQASEASVAPGFRVVVPRKDAEAPSVTRLVTALKRTRLPGGRAVVSLTPGAKQAPPGLARLSRNFGSADSEIHLVGVEVRPIYRDSTNGEQFPGVFRALHRYLSRGIQQCAYEFAIHQTSDRPRHYQALGRRAFVKAVDEVDRQLSDVATGFDLLMLVSPVNTEQAYRSFRRSNSEKKPVFKYRPIDVDVSRLKRALYKVPVERVEDPTIAAIFLEKQRELSLKLDLVSDRFSDRFKYTGVALWGNVDAETVATATEVIERLGHPARSNGGRSVGAKDFATAAQREIDGYRSHYPTMTATVEIRPDISSLMVSSGNVFVGSAMRIPSRRVEALIQHEIGTHAVTYWNGRAQPFRLLATGLAGHDELQEGLGVLAEYLVAGLTSSRLRTVAARVLAARTMLDGAEFIDTFRILTETYGVGQRNAFLIAARVHRGGGLVKDAVYLRGLQQVTEYLAEGRRLDTLLAGKIAVRHVAVIEELQRRGALKTPPLRPAYLDEPDTFYRLERLRGGVSLAELAES